MSRWWRLRGGAERSSAFRPNSLACSTVDRGLPRPSAATGTEWTTTLPIVREILFHGTEDLRPRAAANRSTVARYHHVQLRSREGNMIVNSSATRLALALVLVAVTSGCGSGALRSSTPSFDGSRASSGELWLMVRNQQLNGN